MSITESCWKNLKKDTIKKYLQEGEKATPVLGFEDYYITSTGRIFSSKCKFSYQTLERVDYGCIVWKELKPYLVRGYPTVTLTGNKKRGNFYIHELVFVNFFGEYDKHYFKIVHINRKKQDNRLENLKLEFRNKSQKNIDKYVLQNKILSHLK